MFQKSGQSVKHQNDVYSNYRAGRFRNLFVILDTKSIGDNFKMSVTDLTWHCHLKNATRKTARNGQKRPKTCVKLSPTLRWLNVGHIGDNITTADPWTIVVIINWTIGIAGNEFNQEHNRSVVLNFNTLYQYINYSTVEWTLVQLN